MIHFDFVYIFINILLLAIMWYAGDKISKGIPYWKSAIIVIITFTLVEGLRYDRGVDYMAYANVFKYDSEGAQALVLFNNYLKKLGVTTYYCFMVYALFYITGAMILFKTMKKYAVYIFPIFLISTISFHETFIRQFFAMSFVFLFVYVLDLTVKSKRYVYGIPGMFLVFLVASSIHSISAITIILFLVVYMCFKNPFPWQFSIPALILGKYFLATSIDWSYLNSLLSFLSTIDDKAASYADKASSFFSDEAMKSKYLRGLIIQQIETFCICSTFYLGNKACLLMNSRSTNSYEDSFGQNHIYTVFYNVFVIGCFMFQSFFNFEILRRVALGWSIYWFVPVALLLYMKREICKDKINRLLMIGLFFWLWDYIRFLFVWQSRPLFLWDL